MPITKATGYRASDGSFYATAEEARHAEIKGLFQGDINTIVERLINGNHNAQSACASLCDCITTHAEDLLGILTTGPRSRPGARKKAGTTSPKRAAIRAAVVEQFNVAASKAAAAQAFKAMRQAAGEGRGPATYPSDPSTTPTRDGDVPAEPVTV